MTDDETRHVLESLLARRGNSAEFRAEIEGYLADLGEGALDQHDVGYIRRLAERLGVEAAAEAGADVAQTEAVAEAEPGGDRFAEAKAAFARLFHPDNLDPGAPDAEIRKAIFEEFWAELERIEEDG